jgi:hypothetical protein
VYEYGEYFDEGTSTAATPGMTTTTVRYSLTANRLYASIIYRFSGRP